MDMLRFKVVSATPSDVTVIASFITALADEHRMNSDVSINERRLMECLFGTERTAEAFIGYHHDYPVSYALFFRDFSSFTGETGLFLKIYMFGPKHEVVALEAKCSATSLNWLLREVIDEFGGVLQRTTMRRRSFTSAKVLSSLMMFCFFN
jgi:hypothetical protein